MPLVSIRTLYAEAERGGYALGAFNMDTLESLEAILEAAEAERAPVIVQVGQGALRAHPLGPLAALVREAAAAARVPVAVHLDHGQSLDQVRACLAAGFTSVMIDGSRLPLEENIALTRQAVDLAHAAGVPVEGELGQIGGVEDGHGVHGDMAGLTNPDEVAPFVQATGVDSLAVAIGNAHGLYRREPRLRFDLLRRIRDLAGVPLVLHGGSGIPDEAIRQAIALGIRKINVATELRVAALTAMREALAAGGDIFRVTGDARQAMREVVRAKIRLFGASGRA